MSDQNCLAIGQLENKALMAGALIIIRQDAANRCCHLHLEIALLIGKGIYHLLLATI